MLFTKGFDGGQPIVYLSTDAGQPLTAVLERSTYVPGAERRLLQRLRRLPRLGPRAAVRLRQRADRRRQLGVSGVPALRQGRPDIRERRADQHEVHQRAALRRRHAERVRGLPDPDSTPARRRLQPAVGRPARPVDPQGGQGRAEQAADQRERGPEHGLQPARPADRGQPGHRQAPAVRLGRGRHQLRGDRLHRDGTPRPLARPTCQGPSSPQGSWQAAAGTLRPAGRTGGTAPEAPGGPAMAGPPAMRRPSGRGRCPLFHQEAMAIRS